MYYIKYNNKYKLYCNYIYYIIVEYNIVVIFNYPRQFNLIIYQTLLHWFWNQYNYYNYCLLNIELLFVTIASSFSIVKNNFFKIYNTTKLSHQLFSWNGRAHLFLKYDIYCFHLYDKIFFMSIQKQKELNPLWCVPHKMHLYYAPFNYM